MHTFQTMVPFEEPEKVIKVISSSLKLPVFILLTYVCIFLECFASPYIPLKASRQANLNQKGYF